MKAEGELRYVEELIGGYEGTGFDPPLELLVRRKNLEDLIRNANEQVEADGKKPNRAHLIRMQRSERRTAIGTLVREFDIPTIVDLKDRLNRQGFTVTEVALRQDLTELGIARYRPAVGEKPRLVMLKDNDDYLTTKQLLEFTLANGSVYALQGVRRKDDRLYLACTDGTARHLANLLLERTLPGVVSVMSDNDSTIWIEAENDAEARDIETVLLRYMTLGS